MTAPDETHAPLTGPEPGYELPEAHQVSIAEQVTELLTGGLPVTPAYLRANLVAGILIVALGAWLLLGGLALGLQRANVPGPGVYPVIVGGALVALGALLAVQAFTGHLERGEDSVPPDRAGAGRIVATIAGTLGFVVLLPMLGYTVTMSLYLAALLVFAGHQPWVRSSAIAVVFALASFVVFTEGLGLKLPASPLEILPLAGL